MGMLEELGDRIDAAAVGATVGTNLHLSALPPGNVDAGALIEYAPAGMVRRQGETPTTLCEKARVQLSWRSGDYPTGMAQIRAIWQALECTNTTLGTTFYQRIEASGPPFATGKDDNGRNLFACNFTVIREAT